MCVYFPRKFMCWSPNSQCDCIWRKEVIKVKWDRKGGALIQCHQCPYKKAHQRPPSLTLHMCQGKDMWGHSEKAAFYKPGSELSLRTNRPESWCWIFSRVCPRACPSKYFVFSFNSKISVLGWFFFPTNFWQSALWNFRDSQETWRKNRKGIARGNER